MVQHNMEDQTFDDKPGSCAETLQALQIANKSYRAFWGRVILTSPCLLRGEMCCVPPPWGPS